MHPAPAWLNAAASSAPQCSPAPASQWRCQAGQAHQPHHPRPPAQRRMTISTRRDRPSPAPHVPFPRPLFPIHNFMHSGCGVEPQLPQTAAASSQPSQDGLTHCQGCLEAHDLLLELPQHGVLWVLIDARLVGDVLGPVWRAKHMHNMVWHGVARHSTAARFRSRLSGGAMHCRSSSRPMLGCKHAQRHSAHLLA